MLAFSVWLRGSDRDDTTTPHHHLPPFSQHMINQPVAASAAGLTPMRRPSVSDQQPGFDMGGLAESAFAHQLLAPPPRPPEQLPILLQVRVVRETDRLTLTASYVLCVLM